MPLNPTSVRTHLNAFDFKTLFIEELGWFQPKGRSAIAFECQGAIFTRREIAQLAGVAVFEITADDGRIPDADTCKAVHKEISSLVFENLLIFLDAGRTQSLWYWVKREGAKQLPRRHSYFKGQPGDLFLSKISAMFVDIAELNEDGGMGVVQAAQRLQAALDVQTTTKKFYREFQEEHGAFLKLIQGIDDERDLHWYASILLNRLMFIYFLQKKGFLDSEGGSEGNQRYLQVKLEWYVAVDEGRYYSDLLTRLFFEGFAKPADKRKPDVDPPLGNIPYLNGGLFLEHRIERENAITIPDKAFTGLFALFSKYTWSLDDTPNGQDNEINPDVLGYIFEKYINQKAFGAYYTRTEITEYLCEQTIHKLILDKINVPGIPGVSKPRQYDTVADLLLHLDARLCGELLGILPRLSLLDPACGSGAFLVAAMKTLINIYSAIVGKIETTFRSDTNLNKWLQEAQAGGRAPGYYIKKRIITENLFGVDIMEESTEIAKLRLFLALVSSAQTVAQLEPLPNIDFNILTGNSLIGLLRVTDEDFKRHQGNLFRDSYADILKKKNRMIQLYRDNPAYQEDLAAQHEAIDKEKAKAYVPLNDILLDEFKGIKYERATWDAAGNKPGKVEKRAVTLDDIGALHPFHWGYEFDEVLNNRGGFDAIITNPPWEIFKPQDKEFFEEHLEGIQKNKMRIEDFLVRKEEILREDLTVQAKYLDYLSGFPHRSLYYRSAKQYENQISVVNGKKAGTDINLYKLFTEQCYNLLRPGGQCGIVIPSGIYTDLGTKQLREMLFERTEITGLFCFENRKTIFENVDSRFKFVVLTFEKGGHTVSFPTAFMRHDVAELERFPREGALSLSVELIKRMSPDSISIMEFKNETDLCIAEKMQRYPLLGEHVAEKWNLQLAREFDMSNDSRLFRTSPDTNMLPLVQGGMFNQFVDDFAPPKYWIDSAQGRTKLLGRQADQRQVLAYENYRIVHRRIARNTDTRTLIATVLPGYKFCADTAQTVKALLPGELSLYVVALFNSFVVDSQIRRRVTTHCDMHFMYGLKVPRLTPADSAFAPIVERAARLICTTPEFDDLAAEVGLGSHAAGATSITERARLRAELDGLIAHLYGLTEDEFAHILRTFPLVASSVKVAAQNAYRDVTKGLLP